MYPFDYFMIKLFPYSCSILQIEEYDNIVDWHSIAKYGSLELLDAFDYRIDFWYASGNKNISKYLIRKYQQEINWLVLSEWATLDILIEFEEYIDFTGATKNPNLTPQLIQKYREEY